MSNNRPFFHNFLAAFRAQSTYKPSNQPVTTGSSSLSSNQISQSARAIATKAANSAHTSTSPSASPVHHHRNRSHNNHSNHRQSSSHDTSSSAAPATGQVTGPISGPTPVPVHHYHHPDRAASPPISTTTSMPIPINGRPGERPRRGSDSSSGSGGFRDNTGDKKWFIGGRTASGEERFYRLGMVAKGGGRIGGSGRVGSIDQLSL
ncbi:uncharacterized protein N7515_002581 [Penicillium bovifimosum]|uniref:Uncharacterized protein n=1 Tax=Penicillium bovifimosum TaxID=126998 RepID=A0A9W9HC78_9EURO|nr:uncharacterized protein N7515_002581 [Penicillium bovifimosum]KAJ5143794.1 hypothetical protein N7515_002581 [Penicillium bovifimosum]